uniref:Uncharacterized protein n=1 Tax=Schistocephalus solidus TaxID=70667 RepID=A0A0V0J6M5_SCHSO
MHVKRRVYFQYGMRLRLIFSMEVNRFEIKALHRRNMSSLHNILAGRFSIDIRLVYCVTYLGFQDGQYLDPVMAIIYSEKHARYFHSKFHGHCERFLDKFYLIRSLLS